MKTKLLWIATAVACTSCTFARNSNTEVNKDAAPVPLTANDRYDSVQNGVHFVFQYNEKAETFTGSIKNESTMLIKGVRISVQLSNGKELGPTSRRTLNPGESKKIKISAKREQFKPWTLDAESGVQLPHVIESSRSNEGGGNEHGAGGEGRSGG